MDMEKARRSDEALLALLRQGDEEAEWELYDRYKLLVRARARTFFLVGADNEDLVQEGMLGLYKAVCEYDGSKNASFRSFAELCITRQILTAIKGATRKKHQPLNTYVSLDKPVYEPGSTDRTLMDVLSGMGVTEDLAYSASSVSLPAMPSASRPLSCWNFLTAFIVPVPKLPSAAPLR